MAHYIAELVGFAIIVFVLGRYLLPRVNTAMAQSQKAIRAQLDEAEEAKRRLAAAREEYDNALNQARREAEQLHADAKEQSQAILVEMREQAQADARRIVEQAHQQIESDHQQAFNELHATIGRLTADLAGRVVGESLHDEARQRRVVDRFLDAIEEQPAAAPDGGRKAAGRKAAAGAKRKDA